MNQQAKIRALFFDFDGDTLGLGVRFPLDLYAPFLGTLGGRNPLDELERLSGRSIKERQAFADRRWQRKLDLLGQLTPRSGIREYLDDAKRLGLAVAIVSTDDIAWITNGLELMGRLLAGMANLG
jgi:beta-phosphoglucomutase-like phosphatase (HAD superfamily)